MWWLAITFWPLATATVFFSSAPTAKIWWVVGWARRTGSGAYPRDRRIICTRADGRAWGRGPHAPEEAGVGAPAGSGEAASDDPRAWGRGPHAPEEAGPAACPNAVSVAPAGSGGAARGIDGRA